MKRRKAVTANIFTMGVVVLAIALYFSDHRKEVAMGAALFRGVAYLCRCAPTSDGPNQEGRAPEER